MGVESLFDGFDGLLLSLFGFFVDDGGPDEVCGPSVELDDPLGGFSHVLGRFLRARPQLFPFERP